MAYRVFVLTDEYSNGRTTYTTHETGTYTPGTWVSRVRHLISRTKRTGAEAIAWAATDKHPPNDDRDFYEQAKAAIKEGNGIVVDARERLQAWWAARWSTEQPAAAEEPTPGPRRPPRLLHVVDFVAQMNEDDPAKLAKIAWAATRASCGNPLKES